jgi:RNase P subunit RPR2
MQDRKQFVVVCKRCRLDVPAGVKEFPFRSIVVTCRLCGEQNRYRPSEMIMARPNPLVVKQAHAGTR